MLRNGTNTLIASKIRYYVQRLTGQVFLVREHSSANGKPGPDDRIVRSFAFQHDARVFADNANREQGERAEQPDDQDQHTL